MDVNVCRPLSYVSHNSAAYPISMSQCPPNPNGHAAGRTNAFATRSKPLKPQPRQDGFVRRYQHSSSAITSDDLGGVSTRKGRAPALNSGAPTPLSRLFKTCLLFGGGCNVRTTRKGCGGFRRAKKGRECSRQSVGLHPP